MALDDVVGNAADFDPRSAVDDLIRQQDSGVPSGSISPDLLANRLYRKMRQKPPAEEAPEPARKAAAKPDAPDFADQGIAVDQLPDFAAQGTPIEQAPPEPAPQVSLGITGQAKAALKGIPHGALEGAGSVLKGAAIPINQAQPYLKSLQYDPMGNIIGQNPVEPTPPVAQHPLYRAGAAVQGAAESVAPMTDQEKESIGGRVGTGIGTVAPYLAAGAVNPLLGVAAGGAGMAAQFGADTFDAAIKKGATEEQAAKAAGYSALVGGALGVVPLGMVLKPIRIASPMLSGRAAGYLEEAVKSGLTFATVGEAQEYLVQKIAKEFYDPEAGYSPDAKRAIASLITGGVLGAGGHFAQRRAERAMGAAPAPEAPPATGPVGLPPPAGAAGATGAGPSGGPGPAPGGASPRPEAPRGSVGRDKLDTILRYYGYSAEDIAGMSHAEAAETVLREMRTKGPQAKPAGAESTAEAKPEQTSSTEQAERDGLKRYGWTDDEIASMSPAQRRREFILAMESGNSEPPSGKETPNEAAQNRGKARSDKDSGVSDLGVDAQSMSKSERAGVSGLRGQGDKSVPPVGGELSDVPGRSGAQTASENVDRANQEREGLRAGKRQVGDGEGANAQYPSESDRRNQGPQNAAGASGTAIRNQRANADVQVEQRDVARGSGQSENASERSSREDLGVSRAGTDDQGVGDQVGSTEIGAQNEDSSRLDNRANAERTVAGTREAPITPQTADDVVAAQPVEPKSPEQAQAENYQHAHVELPQLGLEGKRSISIETGVGQERKGIDADGKPWSVKLTHAAYGRIKGSKGADGQPLDIFVGPHPTSPHVFVVDQHHPGAAFDEHKILAGFRTPIDALHAYAHSYNDAGKDRIGHVTAFGPEEFQTWLAGDTTKPLKGEPETPATPASAQKETPAAQEGAGGRSTGTTNGKKEGSQEPLSLLQFIASRGGMEPHSELKALDLAGDHRVQIPGRSGFFGVVRPTGMPLDLMREAAEEAGYLKGEHNKTSTIRDLLDAVDTELRGGRHAAEGEEGHKTKRQRQASEESSAVARDKAIAAAREDITAEYGEMPEGLLDRAAAIMADERLDLDSAVEAAAVRSIDEDADYGITKSDIAETFGEEATREVQARQPSGDGEPAAPALAKERRPGEGEEAGADGERVPAAGAEGGTNEVAEHEARPAATERTVAGEQTVLPGAKKIGQGEQAQRAVEKPLKPKAAQKPADEGLFGDESKQGDLLDKLPAKRENLFVDIGGRRLPLTSYQDASEAYVGALDRTGATISGETGPKAPKAIIVNDAGEVVAHISQNGRVWKGSEQDQWKGQAYTPQSLLYDPREEPNQRDHRAVEVMLGADADKVAPVDIARAAELMADNPDMEPETAFSQAVIENAVEQGFITKQEAIEAYGEEVEGILHTGREGASGSSAPVEQGGTAPVEVSAGGAAQAGELPSGGEGGNEAEKALNSIAEALGVDLNDAATPQATEQRATSGKQAARDQAGNAAENRPAAEDAGRVAPKYTQGDLLEAQQIYREAEWRTHQIENNPSVERFAAKAKAKLEEIERALAPARGPLAREVAAHHMEWYDKGYRGEPRGGNEAEQAAWDRGYLDAVNAAKKEKRHGVPPPVPASNAPAGAENVQLAEPGGQAAGVRGREGEGGEPPVRGADQGRAEGEGRVPEGAVGERGAGVGDVADAGVSEPRGNDAADRREKRAAERAADRVEGENFVIEPGALDEGRGQKAKARDNVKAISTLREVELMDRPATAAEQAELARYVGWGGIKNIFPDEKGAYGTGFEELGPKLRGLLTDEEYDTARRSIQYAHYTSETIVRGMWQAVAKMGFGEGQVFEPGMGVGNFAGMMPTDIAANTHYAGVELDHVTARIAKLLYPKYGVRQDDFTRTPLPENAYDLVIGNPPFADVAIKSDPKYKQGFLLHDYFFAKSIDAVRPGGLLSFVTSAGTMNKIDPIARNYIADRADLIGAIRLPGDAFAKNAGTSVTTDILFFRKRLPDEAAGDRSWTETTERTLPNKNGMKITGAVNRYFSEHPEMVLGEEGFFDPLYLNRYGVRSRDGADLKTDLAAAIDRLPANVMSPWQSVNEGTTQHDFSSAEKKEGTYYIGPNGQLHQISSGAGVQVAQRGKGVENGRTAADIERIRGLVPVRDALRDVYSADLAGDTANADRAREALNKQYDAFVEKFGPINKAVIQTRRPNVIQQEAERSAAREEARYADQRFREGDFDPSRLIQQGASLSVIARERQAARDAATAAGRPFDEGDFDPEEIPDIILDKRPNVDPFMDDPESYRLRAIERYDEGTGKGHKSPVFFENIITREKAPEISSVNDALLYSLSKFGRVNIPEMAALAKKSEAEVVEDLDGQVFRTPGTNDAYQTRDEYLSGDVHKKLALARKAAERNPAFRRNVTALEAAQPIPLAPSQIHASLGMPWIPPEDIRQFGLKELGLEKLHVRYLKPLAQWIVSGDTDSVSASTTWGTADRRAPALIQDALNRQNPKIYDKIMVDGRETSQLNIAKTEAAQDKIRTIQEKFADWIWADQERSDRLAGFYNENFNNLVVREYDGGYLTTPGIASTWSWRPHQKRVIARIIQSGNTYVAHAVGAGKTSEYIGAIMELRRLGLVRKPMVAVPNHMLAQFTKEWYEQYPTARLAVADERRFHTDRRKQFIANVAMDDLDAVIITHSAFGMIPMSDKFQNAMISAEIDQYRELLSQIGGGQENRITRSRVEKQIERLEQRLVGRANKRRDQVFTFEEMGIDHLTVDEAHLFRKLDFATQMSAIKGISPEGSGMAWDLYTKAQYLEKVRPGRGLVLGSGTPITNTMAELYTLSRFLQQQVLEERGIEKFDAWAGAFGASVSELEQDAAGNYKPVSRFAKFVNVAELSAMVRQVMDVVTSRQLEQYVTRPKIKGGKRQMHLAEKSPALVRYQENLAERMIAIQKRKGPPSKGDDIMLSVINDGRHAAIDLRLAGGDRTAEPSKLDLMVENVFRIYHETKRQKFYRPAEGGGYEQKPAFTGPATQLVFINLGLSGKRGFSVPEYIRSELVRRGIPKSEVAYIYDYKSATAKQRLFNDMNEGKVRILMGSVAKMGVGTNVQRRLSDIHNMDPLWYPADDEQRNGRGLRQGNMNPEIGINDYSTKGTYDSTMWGMMAKKAKFIQGFFEGDPSLRDMDDLGEASQYEQAKALTTNDPRLIRFTELKQDLERAQRRKTAFDSEVYHTRQRRAQAKSQMEHYAKRIEETKQDIAQRVDTTGDAFAGKVGKTSYPTRAEFGDALFDRLDKLTKNGPANTPQQIAHVGGFPVFGEVRKSLVLKDEVRTDVWLQMNGPDRHREVNYGTSTLGTVRSIESILRGLDDDLAILTEAKNKAAKFYTESEEKASARFKGDAEIADLTQQVREMQTQLESKEPPKPEEPGSARGSQGEILSHLTDDQIARVEHLLNQVVQKMVGSHVRVKVNRNLIGFEAKEREAWGRLGKEARGATGMFYPWRKLIQLALTDQMDSTAFHEAYHAIEYLLQTPQERTLMEAETPRLRRFLKKTRPDYSDEDIAGLSDEEVRANAFEDYAAGKRAGAGENVHIGIRRWWEKLLEALRKIANGLRGMGFKSYEDIFGKAYEGGYAKSEGKTPRPDAVAPEGWEEPALASIFRRRADTAVDARLKDLMETTAANRFVERYQNLSEPVKRLQEAVEARSMGVLPDSKAFYVKKRLFPGKVATEVQDFNKAHLDELIKLGKDNNLSLADIGDIAYALHAPERNAAMEEINHPALDGSDADVVGKRSGMSDEEAAAILSRHSPALVAEIDHRFNAIRDFNLDMQVASGLISPAMAASYRAKYEHYVPLSGWDVAPEDQPEKFTGPGNFNVRGPETKRAFGRKSKAANPFVNALEQSYKTIDRAKKNEYQRSLYTALSALEDTDLKGFVRFDQGKPKKIIDPMTGLVRTVEDPLYRNEPGAVGFKIGGNQRYMIFENRELGEAIKRMNPDGLGMFQPLLDIQNKLKALWTHYSPDFLARHFLFRYPIEGALNSFEQKEGGDHSVATYVRDAVPFMGRASKAIFMTNKGQRANDPEMAEMQRYWEEMRKAGGSMTFRSMRDTDLLREHLEAKLSSLNRSVWQGAKDKHQAAVEAMDVVTNALDNSLRLAAYASARRQGKTPEQAALIARDATVDFQLAGKWKNAIGLWFPFGNIAIQTGVRMTAAVARSKIMRRVFMGTMLAGFLAGAFNYLIGGDDKDGVPFMDKIPEWDRHLNFIVLNPFIKDEKGRPLVNKVPMPYNWAFPYVMGSAMATMVFGKDKHRFRKMLGIVTKAGVEVATPFGQEENLAAMLAPELTRPLIHAYTNKDWAGRPVHKESVFQTGPNSQSGRKTTGEGWKYIASGVNAVTGGDKRHSGMLDMYPEDIRLMFDYIGGSQRRFLGNLYMTGQSAVKPEWPDATHIPLARVIMGNDYDAADRARRFEKMNEERRPWQR